ncbi:hypothetical protein B0H16DRAFT_510648 [Mycena metata]|uniref:Uncharacterized protein n=1 Tax=Mycena metata TaxID=1033252 RepID=A0AAD7H8K4_9AGAR|nr:hypothetical protein B0H16DRAFT_510648 [Mycena metata]
MSLGPGSRGIVKSTVHGSPIGPKAVDGWRPIGSSHMEPVLLPNLRSATFDFRRSPSEGIQSFEMPKLELFSLRYSRALKLSRCIPASSPRSKVLRVQIQYLEYDRSSGLEHVMNMFPDLIELVFDIPNLISNADILRLIPFHDELPLNPKLQIIRLSNRSFQHARCHWKTLVHLLQARFLPAMGGISALHTFEFSTTDLSNDENVTSGLKALAVENGWNIIVRSRIPFPPWDVF